MTLRPSILPALTGLAIVAACVLAAEMASRAGLVSPFVMPAPSDVAGAGVELARSEHLFWYFGVTTLMTLAAAIAAALIGVPTGWLLARRPLLGRAYESWLGAAFSAPILLLYPLFLVLFGRGLTTIVVMGTVVGFIPIAQKTLEGFRSVPRILLAVAASLRMSERQIVSQVLIPSALPVIFAGVRLSLIYVMINIIALEFLLSMGGLGFLVGEMNDRFDIPGMYAAIVSVVVCSAAFFSVVERLERWLSAR